MSDVTITVAIDGTNRVHSLWHAMHDAAAVAKQFVRDLGTLVDGTRAAHVVVAFDSPRCFRRDVDAQYKLNRAAKEQGLVDALQRSLEHASRGYPCYQIDGFEADDLLASAARQCVLRSLPGRSGVSHKCVIVSPDKDLRQCLSPGRVTIMTGWAGSGVRFAPAWMSHAHFESSYGFSPLRWIDYQCLVGDPHDNIVGADGIGEVTAAKIVQATERLEEIFANRWLVKLQEKQWRGLKSLEPRLPIVRQLVTLRTDIVLQEVSDVVG